MRVLCIYRLLVIGGGAGFVPGTFVAGSGARLLPPA
jgi:hypothetical protein